MSRGSKIELKNGHLNVPNNPTIPFIQGDGTGPDIWRAAVRVLDAAVEKAYTGDRKIDWLEVFAGEKANKIYEDNIWLPQVTLDIINKYLVAILLYMIVLIHPIANFIN